MKSVNCPYCEGKAYLQSSVLIYKTTEKYGDMYICENYPMCDAYVGIHKDTDVPLGRLADKTLRFWKKEAHFYFDPLWQTKFLLAKKQNGKYKKKFARGAGYKWLSTSLNIPRKHCHIGMFDIEECQKVVNLCKPHYLNLFRNKNR